MSNIKKWIKDTWVEIRPNAKWDFIKFISIKIIGFIIGGALMATFGLAFVFFVIGGYWLNWIILISLFLLSLVVIVLAYVFGLATKEEIDELSISSEVIKELPLLENPEVKEAIAKLETKYQAEIGSEKRQNEVHQNTIASKTKDLEKSRKMYAEQKELIQSYDWLIKEAEYQAENIEKYVYWRDSQFLQNIIEDRIYFLFFQIEIFNASIFEIRIDENINGKILFEGQRLRLQKSIYQPPIIIKPNSMARFMLKQELNNDEVSLINKKVFSYNEQREHFHKEMPEGYQFYSKEWLAGKIIFPPEVELKHLEISIKGSDNFPQVKSKILSQMSDVRTSIEDFTLFY